MIRAVIFDLDNTLVDFMKMKELCIVAAVDAMIDAGLPMDHNLAHDKLFAIYDKEGIEYQQIFDRFLEQELGNIDYKVQAAGIVAYRRQRSASLVAYPHVHATLVHLLKKGLKLGVVSDAPRPQVWLRLVQLDLHHLFDHVVTFDDTGVKKPDPKPFVECLRRLSVSPPESIMVGDWAERDVMGAKSIGMKTVFARYGDVFKTKVSGADYEVNDILELIKIIEEENKC
jgi:putative hydrolase of the HAD superfamily